MMYKLMDSKGRIGMIHHDEKLLEFWANQWRLADYKIVKV